MSEYERLIECLSENIHKIAKKMELPKGFLEISSGDDYASLWIKEIITNKRSVMICKIIKRGKADHKYGRLMLKTTGIKNISIPDSFSLISDKKDCAIIYLDVHRIDADIEEFLVNLVCDYIKRFEPADKFGCCHLYKECSAAKKCLHYDLFYAKACWYRKNLEQGKIFY